MAADRSGAISDYARRIRAARWNFALSVKSRREEFKEDVTLRRRAERYFRSIDRSVAPEWKS